MGTFSFSRRERDSNPRSCDRLRISRPAQSTTLASLRGLHNVAKKNGFVYKQKTPNLVVELFKYLDRVEKQSRSFDQLFLYPLSWFARGYKKTEQRMLLCFKYPVGRLKKGTNLLIGSFYTPKRFRTAVAGMKIPSPGPLDDRGDLCDQI